ncbi:MAG: hybrid sensor histidine kinase/response regulator [Hyphomicrobiales bacterium]
MSRTPTTPASRAQQQALLEFAVAQSSVVFYIAELDGDTATKFISSNIETITGHKPEGFLADADYGFRHIHPEDLDAYKEGIASLRDEGALTHEYRFATSAGAYLWFRDELSVVEGGDEFIGCMVNITAEKDAEQRQRAADDMIRGIIEALPLPVSMTRLSDRRVLFENPAMYDLFGDSPDTAPQFVGSNDVYPRERTDYEAQLRDTGSVDRFEMHFKHADGHPFVVAMSSRMIQFHGEQAVVSGLVDLTAQKRREDDLRLARETLEDAIESLQEGFVLYDSKDRLVMCNAQYRAYHGDIADVLVPGAYWPDVTRRRGEAGLFAAAADGLEQWLQGQMAQRGVAQNEEFPASEGRWFDYTHRPTRQGGFVSVWRDITKRKAMEQTLRDREEQFRSMVEGHPLPVWMVDLESSEILYESPAAAELVGRDWPAAETAYSIDHFADADACGRLNDRLRRDGALRDVDVQLRKADSSLFWASMSDRLIDYDGREVSITSFSDLTERREAEAELARQRELLHQSEKLSALGELLAGVSHELNNPLSVLVGQALLLKDDASDEKTAARAEKIEKAADRCARIVRTFLAMARQQPASKTPVDLNRVIESALEVTGYSLRTAGVQVATELAAALPAVLADPDQLLQVFNNLIVNAEHALQDVAEPRRLTVATSYLPKDDQVVVEVRDNGPGIPEEIRSRIFEPLYTTKKIGSGTGLGLALCHRIVTSHGGTLELESAPGAGAAFVITFDCEPDRRVAPETPADEMDGAASYRVLVVDDEVEVAQIICDILSLDGHQVEVVDSAHAALQKIERRLYDAVISDVRMPGMDGPGFYEALREARPEQIDGLGFITGDTLSRKVRDFLDNSDRPYLEKPVAPKDARHLLARLARRGG